MLIGRSIALAATAVFLGAALTGCASTDGGSDSTDSGGESANVDSGSADAGNGGSGEGSAVVTVDGVTWEYSSYLCAFGYDETESDVYSFSSTSFSTADGERIQILVDVRDESGQDRVAGDGIVYEITVVDAGNIADPSINISASGTDGVTISGDSVQVDGTFSSFEGATYDIRVDATCG